MKAKPKTKNISKSVHYHIAQIPKLSISVTNNGETIIVEASGINSIEAQTNFLFLLKEQQKVLDSFPDDFPKKGDYHG